MAERTNPYGPERILHVHRAEHPEDDEASDFAAEILMPEQKFRDMRDLHQGNAHQLAKAFGVPLLAVHRRAAMLGMQGHFIKDLDRWGDDNENSNRGAEPC
jgi:Zn-dependent peptidase ImmA (M78 family)